ncbi:MAG TPA: XRE family transcriptional regulator [Bryobacteraceae bacterium]|nr:XRE family transcriptional regulator [Bryobacteraceae bacterium]
MRVGTPGFVPARLVEGREARGLAQTELAELAGIKSQSISHYEQGRQSPSPEALALLSSTLELPERYFLKPVETASGQVHFRSLRPQGRHARLKAEKRLGWVREILSYLRRDVEFPELALPSFSMTDTDDAEAIERAAEECRRAMRLGAGPLGDSVLALESMGCIVSRGALDAEIEGSCSFAGEGIAIVMISSEANRHSQHRLAAAHELGRFVMRHEERPDPELHRLRERQAARFARALLLPRKMFAREVWAPGIDALFSLKKDWGCPLSAMITRCGELGIFDADQVSRAMINLGRRGWKGSEPWDDREAEMPRLLARSIRLLVEEAGRDAHAILADLCFAAADIEELAGLPAGYFSEGSALPAPAVRLRV